MAEPGVGKKRTAGNKKWEAEKTERKSGWVGWVGWVGLVGWVFVP